MATIIKLDELTKNATAAALEVIDETLNDVPEEHISEDWYAALSLSIDDSLRNTFKEHFQSDLSPARLKLI